MKIHLPSLLRTALLASFVVATQNVMGANMHADITQLTYTDFGQNMGRYAVGNTNAMMDYIRNRDGVRITYTGGQDDYVLKHGMLDFSSQNDAGYGAAIGYNFFATVEHNDVFGGTYTGRYIGSTNAIMYQGVEYRYSENNTFRLTGSGVDYKITRMNKLVTDVTGSTVYGSADGDYSAIMNRETVGEVLYHSGSGMMYKTDHNGSSTYLAYAYTYNIGGAMSIDNMSVASNGAFTTWSTEGWTSDYISDSEPMPYAAQGGDSGSPTWMWNANTQQYEYFGAIQARTKNETMSRGAGQWTVNKMASFSNELDVAANNTIYLNATEITGSSLSDATNNVSTTLWKGTITDANGNILQDYVGVEKGINTWNDLSSIKDTANWYNYGNTGKDADDNTIYFFNATPSGSGVDLTYADLFYTENLNFIATESGNRHVKLNAGVDLGLGYVQFSKADGVENAGFTISSADNNLYQLNSAGYIVDAGVDLHLQLTNGTDQIMREWRKVGEGNMHLEGTGDNNILLNLGGSGVTYLKQKDGYAAYNVLANNGTTVVINDIGQIKRDFTFGFRGGVLDMNGLSMEWNNDNTADAEGFTIHALDEGAIITNAAAGTTTTLTWTQSGDQTWLGSFKDTKESALQFIYNGGDSASLTMHGIYTNLKNNAGSGVEVQSGTLKLAGPNTAHGMGSASGRNNHRYSDVDDWHYADASMDVTVSGGTFELGSHARLTGDISVESGAAYVMREGVTHQYEYVEGGYVKENTYDYEAFYGHKGNVNIAEGGAMTVSYTEGTTANTTYAGNISGAGSLSVNAGMTGGTLTLAGDNSAFTGTKTLNSGGLIAVTNTSLGDVTTNKWVIGEKGWLASHEFTAEMSLEQILSYVDTSSTGVLALSNNLTEQFDLNSTGHTGLIIGAEVGKRVEYGAKGSTEALEAIDNKWTLGGGGGELVVNFLLKGENTLVLGNQYGKGQVTLTNSNNSFTGGIEFVGGVTLDYTNDGALGGATFDLTYSNRVFAHSADISRVASDSTGVLLLNRVQSTDLDLSGKPTLYLGADGEVTYTGNITLANGADYRFGGITGTLNVATTLETGHNMTLDGQTYSGGRLVLTGAQSDFDGTLTLMGYDASKTTNAWGDITLSFGTANALLNASAVTVQDGGVIDLAGTTQTFNNVSTAEGGLITDSSLTGSGVLIINSTQDTSLAGSIHVQSLEKTGNATLTLAGSNIYNSFTVKEGTLALGVNNAMSGMTYVEEGSTLNTNGYRANGEITLNGGIITNTGNGVLAGALTLNSGTVENAGVISASVAMSGATITGTGSIGGPITVSGGDNTINSTGTMTISGAVTMEGGSLTLTGNTIKLTNNTFGTSGQTVRVAASALDINAPISGKSFNGALVFDGSALDNKTITINDGYFYYNNAQSNDGYNNIARSFEHIEILENTTLKLHSLSQQNGALQQVNFPYITTIYNRYHSTMVYTVHSLSGQGDLCWLSNDSCQEFGASRLILDGEGDFSGTITLDRDMSQYYLFAYSSSLVLSHDLAAQNATIALDGVNSNGRAMLALNTENAHIAGLNGNANSHLYTGAAITKAQSAAPTNTDYATLTIQGTGNYSYAGTIGSGATTDAGLHLVMAGSGMQAFSNDALAFERVTVQSGTLKLNTTGLAVTNTLSIHGGATLELGADSSFSALGSLTLNAGNTLSIVDASATNTATLNGNLIFNGGGMAFDIANLSEQAPLLNVTGTLSTGEAFSHLNIEFVNTDKVKVGTTYQLASGDWSNVSAITGTVLEYYDSTFNAQSDGLFITLSSKEGYLVWNGSSEQTSWTKSQFGVDTVPSAPGQVAVFTDEATSTNVQIGSDITVAGILFDSSKDYTFNSDDSTAKVTATTLKKNQSGTVTLESGAVNITGQTTINEGRLVVKDATTLNGGVTGAGTLGVDVGEGNAANIDGVVALGELHLQSGIWTITECTALDAAKVKVDNGGELAMDANTTYGNSIELNGGVLSGDSATTTAIRNDKLDTRYDSTVTISGNVTAVGADSVVKDSMNFSGASFGSTGATVTLTGTAFNLTSTDTQDFHGTLKIDATGTDKTVTIGDAEFSGTDVKRNFEHIEVAKNSTLKVNTVWIDENNFSNVIYTIDKLSGEGDFVWRSFESNNNNGSSRIILSGEGDFNGTLTLDRDFGQSAHKYNASIELAHNLAAKNAIINLDGGNNAYASLAINTDNAQVAGLTGNAYAHVYAGSALTNSTTTAPISNRLSLLTIAGDGDYTYAGTLSSVSADSGISLIMKGSGTQSFSGTTSFNGVQLESGGRVNLGNATLSRKSETASGSITKGISSYNSTNGAVISGFSVMDVAIIDNTDISLTDSSSLTLSNAVLKANSSITTTSATLVANNLRIEGTGRVSDGVGTSLTGSHTLSQMGKMETTISLNGDYSVYSMNFSGLENLTVNGSSLVIDMSSMSLTTISESYDMFSLNFTNCAGFDLENLSLSVLTADGQYDALVLNDPVAVALSAVELTSLNTASVYMVLHGVIPEPGTSSLSLLGLAALLMRRRRK